MSARRLHRYSMCWEGTDRHVDVVLAANVEDIEAECARLREEKTELRDLLRRAQAMFPAEKPEWADDPDWLANLRRDVRRTLDRG